MSLWPSGKNKEYTLEMMLEVKFHGPNRNKVWTVLKNAQMSQILIVSGKLMQTFDNLETKTQANMEVQDTWNHFMSYEIFDNVFLSFDICLTNDAIDILLLRGHSVKDSYISG